MSPHYTAPRLGLYLVVAPSALTFSNTLALITSLCSGSVYASALSQLTVLVFPSTGLIAFPSSLDRGSDCSYTSKLSIRNGTCDVSFDPT